MKKLFLLPILVFILSCESSRDFPEVKNIATAQQTKFVSTLEEQIDVSKNQIYCSTLLYAWQEIKTHFNNNISISDTLKNLTTLNSSKKHINSLSKDEIETSISVEYPNIVAKASFTKSLSFEFEFEKDNYPLTFSNSPVQSFGVSKHAEDEIIEQIDILFYENDNEFGLKLISEEDEHEILLYLPENNTGQSLGDLTDAFLTKIKAHKTIEKTEKNHWRYNFSGIDKLSVPALKFNLEKDDSTLIGNQFFANSENYGITKAYQRIALILDKKGAEIESEAVIMMETTEIMEEVQIQPKHLIFDKPFLLVFKRIDTENPYLVLWIANNELMTILN